MRHLDYLNALTGVIKDSLVPKAATPKERLQEAAHRLAGAAENVEDLLCPSRPPYGIRHDGSPNWTENSDELPTKVREGLKEVRKFADEIEEITK